MQPGASANLSTHGARRTWSSLVLGGLVLAAVVSPRWVRLHLSPSVPYGLYRLTALGAPLARGTLVVLPVLACVQPWHNRWVPLLKPIAGLPGDTVCHRDHTLFVNGADFGQVLREAHGQSLPQIAEGCLVVQPGHVLLASAVPGSLDGRSCGMPAVSTLTARATPLLTWRELCHASNASRSAVWSSGSAPERSATTTALTPRAPPPPWAVPWCVWASGVSVPPGAGASRAGCGGKVWTTTRISMACATGPRSASRGLSARRRPASRTSTVLASTPMASCAASMLPTSGSVSVPHRKAG